MEGCKKKKEREVSKCFLCNNFFPSHTLLPNATLLGTQKWVFLFGNKSRRASEATVKAIAKHMLFSLANQFNTYTSPFFGFGSSVLNGTRQCRIVLLTHSERERKSLLCSNGPTKSYSPIGSERIRKDSKKKNGNSVWWLSILFLRVGKNRTRILGNIPSLINLALSRIAREKAIWLLSLPSPEPGMSLSQ